MDYFEPMRTRRAELAERPAEIEAILLDGAVRAKALALPILEACREAAGLGPRRG
jgi:tryptophanyl-tRNA synthetase